MSTARVLLTFGALGGVFAALWGLHVACAPKLSEVTVRSVFVHVPDDYRPDCRNAVWLNGDDTPVAWSAAVSLTHSSKVVLQLSPGQHTIRVASHILRDGAWEVYRLTNGYPIDAVITAQVQVKNKKHLLDITFDLEGNASYMFQ